MENNRETRKFEIRANDGNGRTISGYAIVWDCDSRDLGFIERIDKGAVSQELIDNSDVVCCYDHEMPRILARSCYGKGTLKLTIDDYGLKYSFEALDTSFGEEILQNVRSGNIFESSFCFSIDENDKNAQTWSKDPDGTIRRTIHKISALYDVSPVVHAAYSQTSVISRKLQEMQEKPQFDPFDAIMTAINDLCED